MSTTYYERYMPIEVQTIKVNQTQATAKKVVFTLPYMVTGAIAQIRATNGTITAVDKVVIAQDATTKVVTVEVSVAAAETLAKDSIVSLIAFK